MSKIHLVELSGMDIEHIQIALLFRLLSLQRQLAAIPANNLIERAHTPKVIKAVQNLYDRIESIQ